MSRLADRRAGEAQRTLDERGSTYGDVTLQAAVSEDIKRTMRTGNFNELPPFMQQSLDMIALKISRILVGDPTKLDSWLDIEGYARLARQTEAKLQGIPDGEGSE